MYVPSEFAQISVVFLLSCGVYYTLVSFWLRFPAVSVTLIAGGAELTAAALDTFKRSGMADKEATPFEMLNLMHPKPGRWAARSMSAVERMRCPGEICLSACPVDPAGALALALVFGYCGDLVR
jgi:hypothetical protein